MAIVQHPTEIDVGFDDFAQFVSAHNAHFVGVAFILLRLLGGTEFVHVTGLECNVTVSPGKVAVDVVGRYSLFDDIDGFIAHVP
ncbi:hypothetical protein D9M70_621650 [compost metagenome]